MEVVILKTFLLITFLVGHLVSVKAEAAGKYHVKEVKYQCQGGDCDVTKRHFMSLKDKKYTLETLREKLRFLSLDESFAAFSFDIHSLEKDDHIRLDVDLVKYQRINSISILADPGIPESFVLSNIGYREGAVFNYHNIEQQEKKVVKRLREKGYRDLDVSFETQEAPSGVDLRIKVESGHEIRVQKVRVSSQNQSLLKLYEGRLKDIEGQLWDKVSFRVLVDELLNELFDSGFYQAKIEFKEKYLDKEETRVELEVSVDFGRRIQFSLSGNSLFSRKEILSRLKESVNNNLGRLSDEFIDKTISDMYERRGYYKTNISLRKQEGETKKEVLFKNYYIDIDEGKKIKVSSIDFRGNYFLSDDEILELYNDKASTLASRGYLDPNYMESFVKKLKETYYENGFVFSEVESPTIRIEDSRAYVEYVIREKQQVNISDIKVLNVPEPIRQKSLDELTNKPGHSLNVVELENDIDKVRNTLHRDGYYFAEVKSDKESQIVDYNVSFTEADIVFDVDPGKVAIFDGVLISGNRETKEEVIEREVRLKEGEVLTPDKVEGIRKRLSVLGLFSSVKLTPFIVNRGKDEDVYLVNLLIRVQEKDFGTFEMAPGYRTDIGVKFSTSVSYNNLLGMNRSATMEAQVNQRLDFANLDPRRRAEQKRLLEYYFSVNYNEPYLFGQDVDFDFTLDYQRKRFFGFDADIFRFSPEVGHSFNDIVSASLGYQFETITQFDATEEKDDDYFKIGSITPTLNFDLRDNPLNPTSGAFFGLSWEVANPELFSLEEDDLVVDFYKFISRNHFYVPMDDKWTLATSLTFGYEKNLATEPLYDENGDPVLNEDGSQRTRGFIPSIKVFRLDGIHSVRGFSDGEINRLLSGRDIGSVVIQDEAYFLNLKVEPRYRVTESFTVGPFFDAGRVYVNTFKPLKLRKSVGMSFKVVTPVGSLDFDYGVKLKRERVSGLGRESFGRFHLAIGHF